MNSMASSDEVLARVNQRTAEIQAKVGDIRGTQAGTETRDRLIGSFDNEFILGIGGDDIISGSFGDDFLDGGDGKDFITGDFGNDYLLGGNGNDRLFGGAGDDIVFGDDGNDLIDGSIGSDVLFGGAGDDNITGGANGDPNAPEEFFVDFLVGGSGRDTLNGFGGGNGNLERDILVGGGAVDADGTLIDISGDGVRDIFVLGNDQVPFYSAAGDEDYALILGFENGIDQLQLSPTVGYSFGIGSTVTGLDTFIFANLSNGTSDLIAIVAGVDITASV
jgi:Ca2+-binding RTX toxin-like protein